MEAGAGSRLLAWAPQNIFKIFQKKPKVPENAAVTGQEDGQNVFRKRGKNK
jgi:hypothetical protein